MATSRAKRIASELREYHDRMQEHAATSKGETERRARESLQRASTAAFVKAMEERVGGIVDERDANAAEVRKMHLTVEKVEDNG